MFPQGEYQWPQALFASSSSFDPWPSKQLEALIYGHRTGRWWHYIAITHCFEAGENT